MSIFKLNGVGIDSTTLRSPSTTDYIGIDLVYTELCRYDKEILKSICKIDSTLLCKMSNLALEPILRKLVEDQEKEVDILLLSPSIDFKEAKEKILKLLEDNIISGVGIAFDDIKVMPDETNIDALEEYVEVNFVTLDISPNYFNKDLIEWCEYKNYMILGKKCYGNPKMKSYLIDAFTRTYLQEFSAAYCSGIILDAYDEIEYKVDMENILRLIDEDSKNPEPAPFDLYKMKSNVFTEYPDLNKLIFSSIIVDHENFVIPIDLPDCTYDGSRVITSLRKRTELIKPWELDEDEKSLQDYLEKAERLENDEEYLALLKYYGEEWMKEEYPGRIIYTSRLCKNCIILNAKDVIVTKHFWFSPDETKEVLNSFLIYIAINGKLYIREVKNQ